MAARTCVSAEIEDLVAELVRLSVDLTWDETILVYCGGIVRVYAFHMTG